MSRPDNQWEAMDRKALVEALLAMKTCPNCRADLLPVALCDSVYGCRNCKETWHMPEQVES